MGCTVVGSINLALTNKVQEIMGIAILFAIIYRKISWVGHWWHLSLYFYDSPLCLPYRWQENCDVMGIKFCVFKLSTKLQKLPSQYHLSSQQVNVYFQGTAYTHNWMSLVLLVPCLWPQMILKLLHQVDSRLNQIVIGLEIV